MSTDPFFLQAKACQAAGDEHEAMTLYGQVPEDSPDYFRAQNNLGSLHEGRGDFTAALACYDRGLQQAPRSELLHYNRGHAWQRLGKWQAAVDAYREALALDENFYEALVNMAAAFEQQGRYETAISVLLRALALDPENPSLYSRLGNACFASGRVLEALQAHEKACSLAPDGLEHLSAGRIHETLRQFPAAEEHYRQALELDARLGPAYDALASLLAYEQRMSEAAEVVARWTAAVPDDPAAEHKAAALGIRAAPSRASDDYIRTLFDGFAHDFDIQLARLGYRAPALLLSAFQQIEGQPQHDLDIVDAGCGTGLCGPLLRPLAASLRGVDLSSEMLAKAAARQCYDELIEAELTAYFQQRPDSCDLIVAADTLIYFGALDEVLAACAGALRAGGLLLFTLENHEDPAIDGYTLQKHGRYCHAAGYIEESIANAGLNLQILQQESLRHEGGAPVNGYVIAARKPATGD